jgi:hypothetical protein
MSGLCRVRLRSNPRWRLIAYDQLPACDRRTFEPLTRDPEFFGILSPLGGSALPVKSVSKEAALLFLTLAEPACLPHLLDILFGSSAERCLQQLVLDGIFEVELDGRFVSGPAALRERESSTLATSKHPLAQLSADAIAYGAGFDALSIPELAARLYLFNQAPSSPTLQRRFADDDRVIAFAASGSEALRRRLLRWQAQPANESWLSWRRDIDAPAHRYKLYISPDLDHLPGAFAIALEAFEQAQCQLFKLGRGAFGLLRSDKLVAYFENLDQLHQASEHILRAVKGASVQGVPFSAPIDADGLLSWAMDPPRFELVLAEQQFQSWRQWLTGRIALYTVAAKEAIGDVAAFVRRRLELDGVDPVTWNPNLAIWR